MRVLYAYRRIPDTCDSRHRFKRRFLSRLRSSTRSSSLTKNSSNAKTPVSSSDASVHKGKSEKLVSFMIPLNLRPTVHTHE
jgi:hypothetical protein